MTKDVVGNQGLVHSSILVEFQVFQVFLIKTVSIKLGCHHVMRMTLVRQKSWKEKEKGLRELFMWKSRNAN
jgi:hypothetical protein